MTTSVLAFVLVVLLGRPIQPHPRPRRVTAYQPATESRRRSPAWRWRRRRAIAPDDLASWCDSLARSVRGGNTLRAALSLSDPPEAVAAISDQIRFTLERGQSLARALEQRFDTSPDLDLVLVMLRACAVNGGSAAEPIDRTAAALRQRSAIAAERTTQSAQARMSALVMTLVPIAMLSLLLATSPSVRNATTQPIGATAVLAGAFANLGGWLWMRRLIVGRASPSSRRQRSGRGQPDKAAEQLPDLVELIVIAVRAGSTPSAAFESVAPLAPPSLQPAIATVLHHLQRGLGLADALRSFADSIGPSAAVFVDSLATADRYGLALGPVLDRLADDIRVERRRVAERHARTLPVKLSFPLVACTLPSFVLLAIVPAVLGAVSTLQGTAR